MRAATRAKQLGANAASPGPWPSEQTELPPSLTPGPCLCLEFVFLFYLKLVNFFPEPGSDLLEEATSHRNGRVHCTLLDWLLGCWG